LIIEAGRAERHYWRDLWRYRELFYFLAWRDMLARYKQTVIGVLWALTRLSTGPASSCRPAYRDFHACGKSNAVS
jgi:hypothetical protein